ncbi:SDR family oxidoreductase [Mucilaginibacter jinjuensis]|uniref:SDR family NAD(P)-dependent oxidoreductase n=1 Tax=Mucilaginibacter jinjuensis TaxID=1176721 RepID=A0ABY7TE06_9SPHI|nr:SDR family NAD(P)-dependent oxidoreductase [Mucilaginibacter jinjuensis]WCT13402.1 SDR family NAD(P)-dependent oxidoreductase [Mucilaginibacter jinjuensis]
MELKGNTILITGGTSGFGFQFASRLIELGNTVIITGRNLEKLEQTKNHLPLINIFQSDVSDPKNIELLFKKVVAQFPALNILINNAGEMRKINLHEQRTLDDITREIEINLMGPIRMVQQFLPHLKSSGQAAILNVTSGIALAPLPLSPVYGASKAGLRSYTQSLRIQLKDTKVKVFELVAPGASTPLNDKFLEVDGFDPKILMSPEKLIEQAIRGIEKDYYEIYPGLAGILRVMSRIAPKFLLMQMGKVGAKMMSGR